MIKKNAIALRFASAEAFKRATQIAAHEIDRFEFLPVGSNTLVMPTEAEKLFGKLHGEYVVERVVHPHKLSQQELARNRYRHFFPEKKF